MTRVKDDNKIARIFAATLELVLKNGYLELRMADVAKQAHLAIGTLYIYFKDKEDLINQLFIHLKSEKVSLMMQTYSAHDSFYITFKKLWFAYFGLSMQYPHKMLFIEQYVYSVLLRDDTKSRSEALIEPLLSILENAQKEHLIKDYSPQIILRHIMGSVLEVVKYFHAQKTQPSQNVINQCFEMTWNGIRQ